MSKNSQPFFAEQQVTAPGALAPPGVTPPGSDTDNTP
jgi:hypothetical protein